MKPTLFIRVPRTASSSIGRHAREFVSGYATAYMRGSSYHNINLAADFVDADHVGVEYLLKHNGISQEWYDKCFRFAFVRNPWDRLVSLYKLYHSFRPERRASDSTNKHLVSFDRFVRAVTSGIGIVRLHRRPSRPTFGLANRQVAWLTQGVDFIGRFENLDADWEELCKCVGMEHRKLTKSYAIGGKPWREWYTDELTKELVESFYAEDIRRFGYKFD